MKNICNSWGAIKTAIKHHDFINVIAKNGAAKFIAGTAVVITAEHSLHKAKIGQLYEYETDKYMNGGDHSSGKKFSFKPNGPSILEKVTGPGGK